ERREQNGVAALEAELVPDFSWELQVGEPRLAGVFLKPVERRLGELPVGVLRGRGDDRRAVPKQRQVDAGVLAQQTLYSRDRGVVDLLGARCSHELGAGRAERALTRDDP